MRCVLHRALLAGVLILSGCASRKLPAGPPASASGAGMERTNAAGSDPRLIVTTREGLDGKVAWVNSNLQFVVITFPVGQMPAMDQRLAVYRRGLKVGEVAITGPHRDDSIVGDIVAGEAAAGDAIRDR
jgi:hypothetical protein